MKAKDVELGRQYLVKVSGRLVHVRLDREGFRTAGSIYKPVEKKYWEGTNLETGRKIVVRSAARLRSKVAFPPLLFLSSRRPID